MDILKKKPCSDVSECQQGSLSFIDPGMSLVCKQKFFKFCTLCLSFRNFLLPNVTATLSFDAEGLTFFKNFLEEDSLKSSLQVLEKEYENGLDTKGELDARMFANDEDSLLGSGSLSGGALKLPGTKVITNEPTPVPTFFHSSKALIFNKIICDLAEKVR